MQISNHLNNSISFQKKLKANCTVLKDNKPIECNIYQLEGGGKDDDYFEKLRNVSSWMSGLFTGFLDDYTKDKTVPIEELYVIEDKNEKCLGYCQINDEDPYEVNFNYLERIPTGLFGYNYKYIAETMLAYMVEKAKTESKESVVAENVISKAKDFYKSNNFEFVRNYTNWGVDGFLDEEYYDKLLDKNKAHTTKSIELIG